MTREEKAIIYFKDMRKRLCEDYLNMCPKDSIAYKATLEEKDFYDTAIQALELVKIGALKDYESCEAHCEESLAEKFLDCIVPIESEDKE